MNRANCACSEPSIYAAFVSSAARAAAHRLRNRRTAAGAAASVLASAASMSAPADFDGMQQAASTETVRNTRMPRSSTYKSATVAACKQRMSQVPVGKSACRMPLRQA